MKPNKGPRSHKLPTTPAEKAAAARKAAALSYEERGARANRLIKAQSEVRGLVKLRDALPVLAGGVYDDGPSELDAEMPRIMAEHDAKVAQQQHEAEVRALTASFDAVRAVVRTATTIDKEAAALKDGTPVALRGDIRAAAKRSASRNPQDVGLRALTMYLDKKWAAAPDECFTRADLQGMFAHFGRHYPNSAAVDVLRKAGAQSFERVNKPRLDILASKLADIQDPELRERALREALAADGLDRATPETMRSRSYLYARIAQMMDAAEPPPPPVDADIGAPAHDETAETYAEVESPNTGEPITVELAPAAAEEMVDFGAVSAFRIEGAMDPSHAVTELDLYLENTGQLYPAKQGILRKLLQEVKAGTYDAKRAAKVWRYLVDDAAKMYVREIPLGSARDVFPGTIRDKVAEQLEQHYVTVLESGEYDYLLRSAQTEGPTMAPPGGAPPPAPVDTGDPGTPENAAVIEDPTAKGEMLQVEIKRLDESAPGPLDEVPADEESFAVFDGENETPFDTIQASSMRRAIAVLAERCKGELDKHRVRAAVEHFDRYAEVGPFTLVREDVLAMNAAMAADKNAQRMVAATTEPPAPALPDEPLPFARTLTAADAADIANAIGMNEKTITAEIMNGRNVVFGSWRVGLGDTGELELTKQGGKGKPKRYAMSKRAVAVRDFIARVAAEADLRKPSALTVTPMYEVACTACRKPNTYALTKSASVACGHCRRTVSALAVKTAMDAVTGPQDYLISIGLPVFGARDAQARALNADRAVALVREVSASAEVIDPRPDSLKVMVRGASLATINRLKTVLTDRLGVSAQYAGAPAAPTAPSPSAPAPGMAAQPSAVSAPLMPVPGGPGGPGAGGPGGPMQPAPNMTPGQAPTAPMPATGGDAQSKAIERAKEMGRGGAVQQGRSVQAEARAQKHAQDLAPPPAPEAIAVDVPAPGMDPGMDVAEPGAFDPALPEGMMDISTSIIDPEGEDLVRSALTHYRNQGDGPLMAQTQFASEYKEFLEGFGDKTSPERHMAEAAVMRIAKEVYEKPAVLKVEGAAHPLGPDHSQDEPKSMDPKIVPSFGSGISTGDMSEGNVEGDLPKPKPEPGHSVSPAVSVGSPESVFREGQEPNADFKVKGARKGRGYGEAVV